MCEKCSCRQRAVGAGTFGPLSACIGAKFPSTFPKLPTQPRFPAPIPAQPSRQPRMQPRKHFSQVALPSEISKHFFEAGDASGFPSGVPNQMSEKKFLTHPIFRPALGIAPCNLQPTLKKILRYCQGTNCFMPRGFATCDGENLAPIPMYHGKLWYKFPECGARTSVDPNWWLLFPMGPCLVALTSWRLMGACLDGRCYFMEGASRNGNVNMHAVNPPNCGPLLILSPAKRHQGPRGRQG